MQKGIPPKNLRIRTESLSTEDVCRLYDVHIFFSENLSSAYSLDHTNTSSGDLKDMAAAQTNDPNCGNSVTTL